MENEKLQSLPLSKHTITEKESLMSDGIYYIYKITNKINNKIYIGFTSKTLEERFKEHVHKSNKNSKEKTYFHKAIKKYGKENFIIEVVDTSTDENYCLNVLEHYYINLYNSRDNTIGYNIGVGGEGGDNYSNNPNKEIISDKISKKLKHYYEHHEHKLKGRKLSKEHIQKIKDSNVGRQLKIKYNTEEYKKLFRDLNLGEKNPMWGKHLSEETKLLLSQKLKGRKKSVETKLKMKQAVTQKSRDIARKNIIKYNKSEISRQRTSERNKERGRQKRCDDIINNLDFFKYLFDILDKQLFTKKLYKELKNCPFSYNKIWDINKNKENWKTLYKEIINAK